MKLLIITQKADRSDPILGFFHRWLAEFAQHVDQLTVVAQSAGETALPQNVRVLSLGKEQGLSRFRQIVRFYHIIRKERGAYDAVFVHMTPVWVVLGAPVWLILRKRVFLWYEARGGGWALPLALLFVRKVFHATSYGLPRVSRKSMVTGHGIDTESFAPPADGRDPSLLCAIGRITRTKHLEEIVEAFAALPPACRLIILGGTITDGDKQTEELLHALIDEASLADRVAFTGFQSQDEVKALLQRSGLMLHACGGGLDKVVLEAMACGCPVVTTSRAAEGVLPEICLAQTDTLAEHAQRILSLSAEEREALSQSLRLIVETNHSLPRLIGRLVQEMQ